MQAVTTIGLDIAKSVFQVHGIDAEGKVLIRRQLKRRHVLAFFQKLQPCLVRIEACATSHHWSRQLNVLGHTVRLMPPAYVKPPSPSNLLPRHCSLTIAIMRKRTVKLRGRHCEISVHREGKHVWVAVGDYLGKEIRAQAESEGAAVKRWRETASTMETTERVGHA